MKKVAIIDDSTLAREMTKSALTEVFGPLEFLTYANVKDARRELPQEQVDHIIVDLMIGADGDGLILIDQLRAAGQMAPAILITANIQDFIQEAAAARKIGYIAKPVTAAKLAAILTAR